MALLPCDADGACMVCKRKPIAAETLACSTCATPWHLPCFPKPPFSSKSSNRGYWDCPDCSDLNSAAAKPVAAAPAPTGDIVSAIRAIQADSSLTEQEKANKRQQLLAGSSAEPSQDKSKIDDIFSENLNCSICMQMPERPVTTPCGHNFCLRCFEKWVRQRKRTCANCRAQIPAKMANQPRINSQLAMAIRLSKAAKEEISAPPKVYHYVPNQDRPDTAFTTERAKKSGKANACCGRPFVTVPPDHFGPIPAENDPSRNRGVLVGDTWKDRMDCRQWGVHMPHVGGIAGQKSHGAQSVALSGGYLDDEDHGEWFLYTGSGGRDLSGNKRTNKFQTSDQTFDSYNESLRLSCKMGYPIRVIRSHKEKRSSYAPVAGLRYDGVYRVEKCWRKKGIQGRIVCRYLFVRCDNEPAPWTSDQHGDRPRPLPQVDELDGAIDLTVRKGTPSWDYDEEKGCWLWMKPPPKSRKLKKKESKDGKKAKVKRGKKGVSVKEKLLKEFGCQICRKVMAFPLTTPCGHNFCKACLEGAFSGQSFIRKRVCQGGRSLRTRKNVMKCPSCSTDIADFLQNPQVNREMMNLIESLQRKVEQDEESSDKKEENLDDNSEESSDKKEENLEDNSEESSDNEENLDDNSEESSDDEDEENLDYSSEESSDEDEENLNDAGFKSADSSETIVEEVKDNDLKKPPQKRRKIN